MRCKTCRSVDKNKPEQETIQTPPITRMYHTDPIDKQGSRKSSFFFLGTNSQPLSECKSE